MRKLLVTAVASCALVAAVPATAIAQGHRGHHAQTHDHTFGRGGGWGLGRWKHAQLTPAATVTSFTNNALTITDNTGNASTGQVTADTRVICVTPPTTNTAPTSTAPTSTAPTTTTTGMGNDKNVVTRFGGGHGFGDPGFGHGKNEANQACTPTTAFTPSASVLFAELTIDASGATWEKVVVELPTAPTNTAPTNTAPTSTAPTSTAPTSTATGKSHGHHGLGSQKTH